MFKTPVQITAFIVATCTVASLIGCTNSSINTYQANSELHSPLAESAGNANTNKLIIKSANDTRKYHSFTLPNQLRVLVISDPETDKAAAALDVHIGSSSDPEDRQGLTHFLEHMLFLGTEKYPESGAYQRYISEHGGSHNAYTAFEHTNYFLDVDKNYLAPTLDRFAQFFIAPLFNTEYVEREKHAVDSEYQSKLKDDGRRQYDVLKTLANKQHPFARFSVGSLGTLAEKPGQPLRDDLIRFYRKHYSANLMTLVVMGSEPLEELQNLVTKLFTDIPNHQAKALTIKAPMFDLDKLPLQVELAPVKDFRRLTLKFPLPSLYPYYRSKPSHYLAYLLGHEGEGSLLSYLKQQGWAEGLSAGIGHNASDASTFQISIVLTREGLRQRDAIIQAVFSQIELIQNSGINRWRFKEQQQLAQMEFDFKENGSGIHYVTTLASQLHHYPSQDVLRAPYVIDEFDAAQINSLLARLTVKNMIVISVAKGLETDKQTRWFNTPYSIKPITPEQISNWQQKLPVKLLALPGANPFIPQHLSVISDRSIELPKASKIAPGLTLWHHQDTEFKTPRADFYFVVRSPLANDSPAHQLLTELYVKSVNEQLSEYSYPAYLAGLNYQLYKHVRGITVKISGYQDKQLLLLKEISNILRQPEISQEKFAIFKDKISRKLQNVQNDRPYNQALDWISKLVLQSSWTEAQLKPVLQSLELNDLISFIPEYLKSVEVVALANGNLEVDEAQKMAQVLQQQFLSNADTQKIQHQAVNKLAPGKALLYPLAVEHPDSALAIYIQGENKHMDTTARFALFNQVLSAPFYHALRTEQQRGYIVFTSAMNLMDIPAITFVIQSPNTSATELAEHVQNFLKTFSKQIESMTEAGFAKHQQALVSRILEKETRLAQRSNRYWREIDRQNESFDRRKAMATAVQQFSLNEFKQDYSRYILGSNKSSLTIMVNGERFPFEQQPGNFQVITGKQDLLQIFE